jgi:hypothetical protein
MTEERPLSLSEAQLDDLDERIVGIESSLLSGFPVASAEQHLHLETKLKNVQNVITLYELIISFREALKKSGESKDFKRWIPKGFIELVIQACCNQKYKDHDIERIFYEYGDINGLLVLYLATRFQTCLFPKINALPPDLKVALAKKSRNEKIPSSMVSDWVRDYDKSKSILSCPIDLL